MIDVRRSADRWWRLDVTVRDVPLALVLFLASLVPALQNNGTRLGDVPDRPLDALGIAVVAVECLPLIIRRLLPAACLALVSLGFALDQLGGYHAVAGTALPLALISAGVHLDRWRWTTVVLASVAYVPLAIALARTEATEGVTGFVSFYLALVLVWGAGSRLRQSRAAEAARRLHAAETARIAERTRIARELHDVVSHHVTAMVVQAEAARYLTGSPERLDEALSAITGSGRRAITDLRHLLELLDPQPGTEPRSPSAGDLRTLVEQARQAGQPVEYTEEGSRSEAPGSAEATAYRVVQEALTNALKHAHGSRTTVLVRHGHREITVEVATDSAGSPTASVGGSGRGLAGLRERVGVLGGEFRTGRQDDGGFVVLARIPGGSAS
ncbi:signal transduction histidine kinase [Amycolatopsis bartoniae]|uniref:sensor histidine kinase n=1 Tax=Amycolatopsis bartoniae TaxID=941986 RepID=UPI001193EF8F|nr:histidine kinase [Amycolatopsis bartoniae]MBB2939806.1 signal transduction histidine kinase [Amycolatopsis bartoniae]TVT07485.1 two-component sensor histidine kinase [Amycolatopsis bartoniae]